MLLSVAWERSSGLFGKCGLPSLPFDGMIHSRVCGAFAELKSESRNVWRYLLVLWLATTILAGSSLCCCTLAGLGLTSSAGASEDCCSPSTSDSTGGCPQRSDGRKHDCPCNKGKASSALADTERVVPLTGPTSACWQFSTGEIVASLRAEGQFAARSVLFGSSAFPHLDGRGILRVVNSLRC